MFGHLAHSSLYQPTWIGLWLIVGLLAQMLTPALLDMCRGWDVSATAVSFESQAADESPLEDEPEMLAALQITLPFGRLLWTWASANLVSLPGHTLLPPRPPQPSHTN
jgi:hypothetical protein